MSNVIQLGQRTYRAKHFSARPFELAGTLDGFIDFATPAGTWPLTLDEARALIAALNGAVADVGARCLYERDALLMPEQP